MSIKELGLGRDRYYDVKEQYWDKIEGFIVKSGLIDTHLVIPDDRVVITMLQRLIDLEKFIERLGIEV